jgi:hypothetical protein
MKQGILASPQVLTITPPSTSGFSQVYLVEAILNDVDACHSYLSSCRRGRWKIQIRTPAATGIIGAPEWRAPAPARAASTTT